MTMRQASGLESAAVWQCLKVTKIVCKNVPRTWSKQKCQIIIEKFDVFG